MDDEVIKKLKPKTAANIYSILADKSPHMVAVAFLNPYVALFDNINKWLGPGELIKASTASINKTQVSKFINKFQQLLKMISNKINSIISF